jgi:hypothetical protein
MHPHHEAMKLPQGKTCADCHFVQRCLGMGFTGSAENTSCDFYPRRFVQAKQPPRGGAEKGGEHVPS